MIYLKTKYERKSFIITLVIFAVMFLSFFLFGLHYMYPPKERGIAVNFGTSEVGMGDQRPTEPVKSAPVASSQPEESQPKTQEQEQTSDQQQEEVLTQDTKDAPVINDKKKPEQPKEKVDKPEKEKQKQVEETPPQPEPEPDPQPDESTKKALENILNGPKRDGSGTQGEGDDQQAGNKGKINGDPNADSYYGQGQGTGGDGNYRLGGREALVKKKFVQNCNQSGTVVVEIKVNRQGEVVKAIPGVKGTTNTDPCLLKPAKRAAMATKFNADPEAPRIQTGKIIYEFKLSD